jgi:hypothetical protein
MQKFWIYLGLFFALCSYFLGTLDTHEHKVYLIFGYVHNTHRVCEARSLFPAGDDHNGIAGLDEATSFAKLDAILDANIDIFQPVFQGGL